MNILVRVAYPNSIQDKRDWGRGVGTWKMTHVKLVKRVKSFHNESREGKYFRNTNALMHISFHYKCQNPTAKGHYFYNLVWPPCSSIS